MLSQHTGPSQQHLPEGMLGFSKALLSFYKSLQPPLSSHLHPELRAEDVLGFSHAMHLVPAHKTDVMTVPSGNRHREPTAVFSDR